LCRDVPFLLKMANYNYLTQEGLEKLNGELNELKTRGRAEMAKQIREAREKGDLSENAEYHAAKEAQGLLELKIAELEQTISNSRILDKDDLDSSKALVLSYVKIKNLHNGKVVQYQLVAESEVDIKMGKISVNSPIGKGLLGKVVGEIVEINAPTGKMSFEIIAISR